MIDFSLENAKVVCNYTMDNIVILSFKENREIEDIKDCGDENGEIAFWSIEVRLKDISKAEV